MKRMKRIGRLTAVLCLLAMLFTLAPITVAARTTEEIQQEIDAKKAHLDDLAGQISASRSDKAQAQSILDEYAVQYDELLGLITEKEVAISQRENEVDFKTQQIAVTMESISQNRELFASRMRAIYDMNSTNAMLGTLLSVTSYSDLVLASDVMQRISKNDTEMLQSLSEDIAAYEEQKVQLEESIAQLDVELAGLQEDRDWCNAKMQEMQGQIQLANASIAAGVAESDQTKAEVEDLQQELARVFAEQERKSSTAGDTSVREEGPLAWPVSGGGTVTSWFGDPRSNTGYHYGIDITSPADTPVLAAKGGTVITAEWHYSYGNYIVIDHGQGLRTLYAHCNNLYVGAGAQVETGTPIAGVGNTGDSYGNHLHFEVHENGARQNPLGSGYLSV